MNKNNKMGIGPNPQSPRLYINVIMTKNKIKF